MMASKPSTRQLVDAAIKPNTFEVQPLRRAEKPAEPYPVDALGIKLSAAVKAVHDVIKAPLAMCAQSFLAGAAVCVQGVSNLELHSRKIPLSEFFLTIAESGERKSAVDNIAKHPHTVWQREKMKAFDAETKSFNNAKSIFDKERSIILNSDKALKKEKAENIEKLEEPIPPRIPLLFSEEPTFEGVFRLLANGLPSIGIFSDEGGRMLGGHAMNADNRLKTISGLSKLWDGASIDRVRSGDGCSVLYDRRCSVHLMAQPGVADTFLSDGVSTDQGIISRFLMVKPESTKGTRMYNNANIQNDNAIFKYNSSIVDLLNSWEWDSKTGELEFKNTILISDDAMQVWTRFYDEVESQQKVDGLYREITGFASKAAEHAARLAGIMQIFDKPGANLIEAEYMEYGVKLLRFHLSEAIRVKHAAIDAIEILEAEKLLEWLKNEKLKLIYPVKVYQSGPGSIRSKSKTLPILKLLEDHGYLMPIAEDQKLLIDGKIRKQAWRVNAYSVDEILNP